MPTSELTETGRIHHIATILALGVRRHRQLRRRSESSPQRELSESSPAGLDVLGKTRLSVSRFQG